MPFYFVRIDFVDIIDFVVDCNCCSFVLHILPFVDIAVVGFLAAAFVVAAALEPSFALNQEIVVAEFAVLVVAWKLTTFDLHSAHPKLKQRLMQPEAALERSHWARSLELANRLALNQNQTKKTRHQNHQTAGNLPFAVALVSVAALDRQRQWKKMVGLRLNFVLSVAEYLAVERKQPEKLRRHQPVLLLPVPTLPVSAELERCFQSSAQESLYYYYHRRRLDFVYQKLASRALVSDRLAKYPPSFSSAH